MNSEQPIQVNFVNQHYLQKVMGLAEEMTIAATEDICDQRGLKLVAKGTRISSHLQEKLILHKLCKPLELSIAVEGGITSNEVVAEAKHLIETIEPISYMLKTATDGQGAPFDVMASAPISNAMSMMLTMGKHRGNSAFSHSVNVSLVSMCLAKKLGLSIKDQQIAGLAGLLHDIGELYIQPEYLQHRKTLRPSEWHHIVVHPRIGQMLLEELEDYPPAVGRAVAEHHERFDGSGYPRQISGKNISLVGQVVSVAEMISGVFMRNDRALERAELALKIIPGEHPAGLVSAVSEALQNARGKQKATSAATSDNTQQRVVNLHLRIVSVLEEVRRQIEQPVVQSKQAKELLQKIFQRAQIIQRAFCSTGLYICLDQD
ncbi:MAG: HD domain-containing protein [Burkholderiaceae bacterium]|nr:HD domain-containing protein [Burkholderiaceae bacterium]